MIHNIPDAWGKSPIRVWVLGGDRVTVSLSLQAGSLTLGHHMSPTQARDMAAALLQCADAADAREFDECLAGIDDAELADLGAGIELADMAAEVAS